MSSTGRLSRQQRVESIARLVPRIGQPSNRASAAAAICDGVRALLGVEAAALYVDDGKLSTLALRGFTLLPPDGLPASLEPTELRALAAWARRGGLDPVELAPLSVLDHRFGVLALFGGDVEPLAASDLQLLGGVCACLLEQARVVDDLRRAYETQERSQERVVRSERLRVLGEMALGVAHDFNNVLNAVLGQVGVLELLASKHDELGAPIQRIKQVALDGAATVSRLQDFSRQRRDQEFTDLCFSDLVGVAARELRAHLPDSVALEERIDEGIAVRGNAQELLDVARALLDNAIEAKARHLRITLERAGGEAELVVVDDGCGMTQDVRRRAFDPFFTTKGSLVSGLGLSVAYGIVRRHGGGIDIDSAPGRGARVRVRLPALLRAAPAPRRRVIADVAAAAGGARILLVEDDEDNREAMATLLGLGGHQVTAASSGSDGVRRFTTDDFDLVLTDLGLPDMTGWEVARQVKDVSSATPVALITGWGLNLAQDEIRRRGVDLLIKKPIEPRKFLQQLAGLSRTN